MTANHTISASFANALAIYYKFDETSGNTAADSSGNARNGTVTQGTTLGWAAGQVNNCLRFGTTSTQYAHYVTEPAITGTYTGFTMSMWVNPGGTTSKYLYYEATAATGAVRLQISGTTSSRVFTLTVYNGSTAVNYAFTGVAVTSNAWSHVAFTYDNTSGVKQVKFYLNGALQQTLTISTSLSAVFNSGTVYIGNQGTSTTNSFVGYLDDFRLYTAPLSGSFIAGIYDSTIAHTITASAGPNGAISPTGPVTVNPGASQTFTITPSAGYAISDLKIDGTSITPVISYTFPNVTASHTISATFEKLGGMSNRIPPDR